jgi:hypothetical protein
VIWLLKAINPIHNFVGNRRYTGFQLGFVDNSAHNEVLNRLVGVYIPDTQYDRSVWLRFIIRSTMMVESLIQDLDDWMDNILLHRCL